MFWFKFHRVHPIYWRIYELSYRADSRFAPSQWETALLCWHSSSTHIYVSECDWIEYYATLWSWWSYNNRNGYVVEVAARVVTGGAEACLQRLRWWLGRSSWRHIRFIDEIAMHSYLLYTVFNTLRPRQDGCLFADDILKCIFLNGNSWIPNKISWEYVA